MDRSPYDYLRTTAPLSAMIDADAVPVRHDPVRRPIDIRYPGRVEAKPVYDPNTDDIATIAFGSLSPRIRWVMFCNPTLDWSLTREMWLSGNWNA